MVREFFVKIASLGLLGELYVGGIVASLLALPTIYFLKFVNNGNPIFWTLFLGIIILSYVSIWFSLKENEHKIVINKFVGGLVAFFGIPLTLKVSLAGLIFFNILMFILPVYVFIAGPHASQDLHGDTNHIHSNFLKIIITSLMSGIIVNVFLRFTLWLAL